MNEKNSPNENDDLSHHSLTFSLDRGEFFRRACSSCGLHFKLKADADDLAHSLAPAFKQIEQQYNIILAPRVEEKKESNKLKCPYCGHADKPQEMLTEEFSHYFIRWAEREIIAPMLSKFYDDLSNTFNRNRPRKNSFISFDIKFSHDEVYLPIRPISGPEPPDMIDRLWSRLRIASGEGEINTLGLKAWRNRIN